MDCGCRGLGVGFGGGGVPGAILLGHIFCAVKQSNRIVVQHAAVDENVAGFVDCSEEKGDGHGASDCFRDRHFGDGFTGVDFARPGAQVGCDEVEFGTASPLGQVGKRTAGLVRFFRDEFSDPVAEKVALVPAEIPE